MQAVLTSRNPAQIAQIPGLYISDITIPSSPIQLTEHGITHLLSIMSTSNRPVIPAELNITHKFILLEDDASADLLGELDEACTFIDDALRSSPRDGQSKNKVLVHCLQGISRSGGVVVGYVMKILGITYTEALEVVRKYRPIVTPNLGFGKQLESWANMDHCTKDKDGAEKEMYKQWRFKGEMMGVSGENEVHRQRVKSMAGLAARVGRMRIEAEFEEARKY